MTQAERVWMLIHKLRRCFRFIHHRVSGGRGSQNRVLLLLRMHEEMTQRHLQAHMDIQQSSLSELLKKMEEQNLLERTVCSDDRRQVRIRLTKAGEALVDENEEIDLQQNIRYLQVLTEEEQEQLLELLSKLDQYWTEEYPCGQCRQNKEEKS